MADEQGADGGAPPEQPPAYFSEFEQKIAAGLNQFARNVDQRLSQLGSAAPPPQQAAPPQLPADAREQFLEQLGANPFRVVGEIVSTAKKEAVTEIRREQAQQAAQYQQTAAWNQFWNDFAYYNQDLGQFGPQVMAEFTRNQHITDFTDRANEAAKNVRALLAQQRADAVEQAERQRAGRRMAAAPPGFPVPQAEPGMNDGQARQIVDPRERLEEIKREHDAQRAKKQWNGIDTSNYRDGTKERPPLQAVRRRA